jgi:hypothetical protein
MARPYGSLRLACVAACVAALCACAPEVGSERWCEVMQDRPRGDWSTNDALDYTRYCIFDRNSDE